MKFKKLNLIIIGTILIITVGGLTFAVQVSNPQEDKSGTTAVVGKKEKNINYEEKLNEFRKKANQHKDEILKKELAESSGKSVDEVQKLKQSIGNWNEVSAKLNAQKDNKILSEEKIIELREKGYSFFDIDKAEQLSAMCNKSPEQILEIKGTTEPEQRIADENKNIANKSKTWEEVSEVLNIDIRSATEKLGVEKNKVEELKNDSIDEETIINAAIISKKYGKKFDDVILEVKKGKKITDIDNEYNNEHMLKPENKTKIEMETQAAEEKAIIKQFGISNEMISKAHEHGVSGINVINIKNLVDKYNVSIEKVLKVYDDLKDWNLVYKTIGGAK